MRSYYCKSGLEVLQIPPIGLVFFIIHHVQNAIEKEHAKNWIIICLKILYSNNDFNNIRFDRECQFLQILNTFDMPL